MPGVKRIAVYCGSAKGVNPVYTESDLALTRLLHKKGIGIVYGGGNIGLMGIMADEMIRLGGEIIGVIPKLLLEREVAHHGLTELIVVSDMHQRKSKMFQLSDAVIAMPGGIGTMEELFEAYTWTQVGFHQLPCGLLNTNNYYHHLIGLLNHMTKEGFLKSKQKEMLLVANEPETLLDKLLYHIV